MSVKSAPRGPRLRGFGDRWGYERKKSADVGSCEGIARSSADSSQARRHGRRRAVLAALPAAPAAPLPKNLAALRFSGALLPLGVSATGGVKSDEISGKKPVFFLLVAPSGAANLLGDCRAHTEADFRFIAVFAHSEPV